VAADWRGALPCARRPCVQRNLLATPFCWPGKLRASLRARATRGLALCPTACQTKKKLARIFRLADDHGLRMIPLTSARPEAQPLTERAPDCCNAWVPGAVRHACRVDPARRNQVRPRPTTPPPPGLPVRFARQQPWAARRHPPAALPPLRACTRFEAAPPGFQ